MLNPNPDDGINFLLFRPNRFLKPVRTYLYVGQQQKRKELLLEFINEGFKATIVAVRDGVLDRSFLGRVLDEDTVKEIEEAGVDASGEEGEFHTVVTDGPVFSFRIDLKPGEQYFYEGCWFQDVSV